MRDFNWLQLKPAMYPQAFFATNSKKEIPFGTSPS